ncbi:MAG: HEAT repeat domain-containing protein [Acidimicrobiia bacterium]|nr:HEAT repeat domain-containing protein [Acidimicrobiia bacterium]
MRLDRPGDHRSGERRRAAALAGHLGDAATARAFLDDPDPAVRATALGALQRCDALEEVDVAAGLADVDPGVRRRALVVGCTFPGTSDLDLVALLADPDDTVVETAAFALGEQEPPDPRAAAALCEVTSSHTDALCREAAVAALGAIGDPTALDTILAATTDIATVRRRAVIALAPFDGPEVDAALERARSDRDWQVRQAAEDLLAD